MDDYIETTKLEDMDEEIVRRLLEFAKQHGLNNSTQVLESLLEKGEEETEKLQVVIDEVFSLIEPQFKKVGGEYKLDEYWDKLEVDLNRFGSSL